MSEWDVIEHVNVFAVSILGPLAILVIIGLWLEDVGFADKLKSGFIAIAKSLTKERKLSKSEFQKHIDKTYKDSLCPNCNEVRTQTEIDDQECYRCEWLKAEGIK